VSELRVHDITLTGERVTLRPMTEHDWPLIEAINNDPEVGYFAEEDEWAPYALDQLQRIYRSISENALLFVVEHEGQPVGECWLQRMNLHRVLDEFPGRDVRRIDLAIGSPRLWGKGLGSESIRLLVHLAFEREGVDLLVCFCGGHNPRSKRAFEKAGFAVLRTVPRPDSPKANFGYDLLLTRERYERSRDARPPPPTGGVAAPARAHPRLVSRWTDDPDDPRRLPLDAPDVRRLCAAIAPGARLADVGGVMSLNVRLDRPDSGSLVLRVHQPEECVSRLMLLPS
jgi:RimJ/RimL family protein N-acetyltransferase